MNPITSLLLDTEPDDYLLKASIFENPKAVRRALLRSKVVDGIREGLGYGIFDRDLIFDCLRGLIKDLRIGERFEHDLHIAMLCVAMEEYHARFVDELINDLSQIQIHEMRISSSVARISKGSRSSYATNVSKNFAFNNFEKGDESLPDILAFKGSGENISVTKKAA